MSVPLRAGSGPEELLFDPDAAVADALARKNIVVPPYPAVAVQLNRLINSDDYDVAKLSEVVSMDPVVSAIIVGVSNSTRFARPAGVVTTVEQAVSLLGATEVAQIAMAGGLSDVACAPGPLADLKYLVWRQSVYTAMSSKHLAPMRSVDPAEALLCGLLIGLGRTVTLACIERVIAKDTQAKALSAAQWMSIVERQQSTVGVYIAHKWEVPSVFVEVLSGLGEEPEDASLPPKGGQLGELVLTMAECVHVLDANPLPDRIAVRELLRSERECDAFLEFAPGLPSLLSALTSGRTKPPRRRPRRLQPVAVSMVLPAASSLSGDLHSTACGALLKRSRGDLVLKVERLGLSGAVLVSPEALRANWATRLVIQCEPAPIDVWVSVKTTIPCENGHRVEVQPFALGGEAALSWQDAVTHARSNPPLAPAEPVVNALPPPVSARRARLAARAGRKRR